MKDWDMRIILGDGIRGLGLGFIIPWESLPPFLTCHQFVADANPSMTHQFMRPKSLELCSCVMHVCLNAVVPQGVGTTFFIVPKL